MSKRTDAIRAALEAAKVPGCLACSGQCFEERGQPCDHPGIHVTARVVAAFMRAAGITDFGMEYGPSGNASWSVHGPQAGEHAAIMIEQAGDSGR